MISSSTLAAFSVPIRPDPAIRDVSASAVASPGTLAGPGAASKVESSAPRPTSGPKSGRGTLLDITA